MDLALSGKVVVVTGGAKGIGEAIVRALVAEDAIPVIVDRDEAAATRLRDEISAGGHRCQAIVKDLAEPGTCRGTVEEAIGVAGQIDALVNNAGVNDGVSIEDGSAEDFMESLRRSLVHYFEMTHFSLPSLKEARGVHREHRLEGGPVGAGWNLGIRRRKGRHPRFDPRMGGGPAVVRNPL